MKVLISGANGLVGRSLAAALRDGGDEVRALARNGRGGVAWDPGTGSVDREQLRQWGGPDAVVHLAGENIAARRWSAEQKGRIRDSRVAATEKLAATLLELEPRPAIFVSASAVGIYGNRGDEVLTEGSAPGNGFLAEVCLGWEAAGGRLERAGVRVARLRFGMILAREGGALGRMLPLFRRGLGGRLGSGRQWMSWIALEDVTRAIQFCLREPLSGAFNAVAPNPVTNLEFTRTLAKTLRRPAVFPVPAFALRLALGEMADALVLGSQRAAPERFSRAGFAFRHRTLAGALENLLR